MPSFPKITIQSLFTAAIYAVAVGGVFYAAKKGASMVGGSVQTAVETVAAVAGQ